MATTFVDYTGDGNATKSFSFPSIKEADIKVEVDTVVKTVSTHYNITSYTTTGGGNVVFTSGNIPASPAAIRIYRDTDVDSAKATYTAGSSVKAGDLNNNQTQLLYAAQEEQNQTVITSRIKDAAVTTAKIKDDNVTMAKLASGALPTDITVASANIVDGTIVAGDIANSAITTDKLNNLAVTTAKITDANITTAKIADSNVTTAKIAADAVTGAKIADDSINSEHYVDGSIDTAHIADSQITSAKIADGTIVAGDLASNAVTTAKILDDNVTADKLAHTSVSAGSYTAADITVDAQGRLTSAASGTIATGEIADSAVTAAKIASNAVTTDKIADSELSTLAGMQSGTASKLAAGTTLTADIADLNQIDGLTKQTTISDSDASFPTSGAVVDYVAAQLEPFGGFEAIANEVSFPNTQPASGVAISIADAAGIVVNGSGVSTTGRTVGGSTVTINGINSQFNSSTIATGIRFIVTSTGSGQVYNYHKSTLPESDLVNLSGDINDFNERYRVGSSNPSSSLDNGDLFFNTSTGKLLVYNGTNSAWEEAQSIGNFFISTLSPAFDGTTQDFTLTNAPTNAQQVILSINGVVQKPNAGSSAPSEGFALSGSTVKLSAAPATGSTYHAVVMGSTVNIGTPSNNTVTTAILQNGSVTTAKITDANVTTAKIADQAVTLDKLLHGDSNSNGKFLRANNGADPTFESVITDLVNDTSPQLGGNLDLNSNDVNGTGNIGVTGSISGNSLTTNAGNIIINSTAPTVLFADSDANPDYEIKVNGGIFDIRDSTNTASRFSIAANGEVTSQGKLNCQAGLDTDGDVVFNSDTSNVGITFDASTSTLNMSDSQALSFGDHSTTGDYQLSYVNGSDFNILGMNGGSGDLVLGTFASGTTTKTLVSKRSNQALELYFANNKKLETVTGGVTVTGTCTATSFAGDGSNLTGISSVGGSTGVDFNDNVKARFGTGNDLEIYHNGTVNIIDCKNDKNLKIVNDVGGGNETMIECDPNGGVSLFHNGTMVCNTASYGLQMQDGMDIQITDSDYLYLGNAGDMALYHNGTDSYASNSGGKFRIGNTHSDEIKLFTGNSTRWNIGGSGHIYPDVNNTYDIGTSTYRVRNIYTNDLHLSNEGHSNEVDGTWGNWTIQEGESDLFLKNNRSGKKYKFNLTEVS